MFPELAKKNSLLISGNINKKNLCIEGMRELASGEHLLINADWHKKARSISYP